MRVVLLSSTTSFGQADGYRQAHANAPDPNRGVLCDCTGGRQRPASATLLRTAYTGMCAEMALAIRLVVPMQCPPSGHRNRTGMTRAPIQPSLMVICFYSASTFADIFAAISRFIFTATTTTSCFLSLGVVWLCSLRASTKICDITHTLSSTRPMLCWQVRNQSHSNTLDSWRTNQWHVSVHNAVCLLLEIGRCIWFLMLF